jgi:hypothetical protein
MPLLVTSSIMLEANHMKDHILIFVCMFILCSVSCTKTHSRSQFLNNFSLGETIKRINVEATDVSSLSTATGGNPSSHRREFDVEITIKGAKTESFDEQGFLGKLKELIVQEAGDSGSTVSGVGGGGDTFHVDYQNEKHRGGIDVIGVRTEKNKYRVWCVIRELAP